MTYMIPRFIKSLGKILYEIVNLFDRDYSGLKGSMGEFWPLSGKLVLFRGQAGSNFTSF